MSERTTRTRSGANRESSDQNRAVTQQTNSIQRTSREGDIYTAHNKEEEPNQNTQEQARSAQATNLPETPEDILRSPQREINSGSTLEESA